MRECFYQLGKWIAREKCNNRNGDMVNTLQYRNKELEREKAEAVKMVNGEMENIYHSKMEISHLT